MATRTAEIQMTHLGSRSMVEMSVPRGTTRVEAAKLHDMLIRDVLGPGPRGCEAGLSGMDILIRERFENVLTVDLDAMKVIGR